MTRMIRGACVVALLGSWAWGASEGEPSKTPAPPAPPAPKPWNVSGGVGLSLSQGNTENMMGNANLGADWTKAPWAFILKADGEYGEDEEKTISERAKGSSQVNLKMSDVFYWLFVTELERDAIADVEYRLKGNLGVGYKAVDQGGSTLVFEVAPGYMREKLGSGAEDDVMTLRFHEGYQLVLQEGAKLWESVDILPDVTEVADYLLNAEIGIEAGISKQMRLRCVLKESYDSEPALDKERSDLSLITSVLWKF